jgi:phosphoribosylanthranilate isomerase
VLKTKVKASQVTNLTDGRYFAAWEVEWIGFNFEMGSENYIEPRKMKEIRGWLEGPKFIGEFGLATAEMIRETATYLALDLVQLNHFTDVETAKALSEIPLIKEVLILKDTENSNLLEILKSFEGHVNAFLIDFTKAGISWEEVKAGTYLDFEILESACANHNIILSVDLTTENLSEVQETLNSYGLNVTGGEEEKVGYKSFDDIDEIIEELYIEV